MTDELTVRTNRDRAVERLTWLWARIGDRGGHVDRIDLDQLQTSTIGALADEAERVLRVLAEGA